MRTRVATLLAGVLAATLLATPAGAASPPGFQTSLVIGNDLDEPSGFEIAPDGRIFILERSGTVKIFKDGHLLATPFAVLPSEPTGDRGLIGIAFDPGFGVANHYVYFYYTGLDLHNRVVRFDASGDVGTGGPYQILKTASLSQQLHVGGSIRFGPDQKLYLAVGDNGYAGNGQLLSNPHGKILRINPDGSVPTDNPFYGQAGRQQEIWAYGFRNPWRFQFDPLTGELYGGDVGDYTWEEVNRIVKGGNYGWPLKEGRCTAGCAGFIDPVHTYPHDGESAAATGGPVYRGGRFPAEYQGNLFFADYAKGFIRRAVLDADGNVTSVTDFDPAAGAVVDLKQGPDGALYYLTYIPGRLYKVTYRPGDHAPTASATSDVTGGPGPLTVHFSGAGSRDPDGDPLTYAWDFGDGTTSTAANPAKTYSGTGVHRVGLTVTDSAGNSSAAVPIIIQVGIPPAVRIAVPAAGSTYRAGDVVTYNAFATDAAGFDVDDNDITTTVVLHHGTHIHPFAGPFTGRAGQFTIPTTGEPSADTWYAITTRATDANGLSAAATTDIRPRTTTFTVTSDPPGLPLHLDGVPVETPHEVLGVEGFQRELYAPPTAGGHHFTGWSDGKGIRHTVVTPEAGTTYTATYAPSPDWTATFYGNRNLSGTPLLTRSDPVIDFRWGDGSPGPGVPADDFSARWTRKQYLAGGRYRFTTVSDDGVRLYIDRRLVLDHWAGQSGTAHEWTGDLGAGQHTITLEYFEEGGAALAALSWAGTVEQPDDTWQAEYWAGTGAGSAPAVPSTPAAVVRTEPAVDHDWGTGSPDPSLPGDDFIGRWTRTLSVTPGEYEFTVTADGGARLTVDGRRLIDAWQDAGARTHTVSTLLGGGPHTVTVEYFEDHGDAVARLALRRTADAADPPDWTAEFWNTPEAGESPAFPGRPPDLTRLDPVISNDWGDGSPDPAVTADKFMARWTRTVTLPAGTYRFAATGDDGIRVRLDGATVVDGWSDHGPTTFTSEVEIGAGVHTVVVEYYESGGGAVARFTETAS